jgi:hypothetical protein
MFFLISLFKYKFNICNLCYILKIPLKRILIRRQNSLDSQFGPKGTGEYSTNPTVFEAWKKAREAHEKRYRILQDGEEYGQRGRIDKIGMEHVIERKRCRKCKKPISVRQFVRQSRNE